MYLTKYVFCMHLICKYLDTHKVFKLYVFNLHIFKLYVFNEVCILYVFNVCFNQLMEKESVWTFESAFCSDKFVWCTEKVFATILFLKSLWCSLSIFWKNHHAYIYEYIRGYIYVILWNVYNIHLCDIYTWWFKKSPCIYIYILYYNMCISLRY